MENCPKKCRTKSNKRMEEHTLEKIMLEIDYHIIKTMEHILPDGKKLVQLDFEKQL